MKQNKYLVLFCLLLGIGVVSCNNESEDLFDKTAAERKTEAIEQYDKALKSAEKGWLFQFFTMADQDYTGGYNYVVKFNENDTVQVWTESEPNANAKESLYDVISYGGPVLSFITYNSFMHFFATPSFKDYEGKGGDFEFSLKENKSDTIILRGLKTQRKMRLIKMTESPEEYFSKAKAVTDFLRGAVMEVTVKEIPVEIRIKDKVLTFSYKEEKKDVLKKVAFIYTDKGIRLYKSVEILGVSSQDFTLDEEREQLIADNGKMIIDIYW